MGELKVRMEEEMTLRGLRPRSRKSYLFAVPKFVEFHGRSPMALGQEEIRAYVIHLLAERKLARSSVNQALCALKFFYHHVLDRGGEVGGLPVPRRVRSLPVIHTRSQVGRILSATDDLLYRTLFMTLYATGLRIGEGCRLQVGDIGREAMRICVRDGKGGKDRAVLLPPRLLRRLEVYRRLRSGCPFPSEPAPQVEIVAEVAGG